MIKNIPITLEEVEVSEERRQQMAHKGTLLYAKYCGLDGCGICAESFAEYHIARGEYAIARDYIQYLINELETLSETEHTRQREITERLIERIKDHLGEEIPA